MDVCINVVTLSAFKTYLLSGESLCVWERWEEKVHSD